MEQRIGARKAVIFISSFGVSAPIKETLEPPASAGRNISVWGLHEQGSEVSRGR
jgi:hypothetical protein